VGKVVEIPGVGNVEFPDDMTDEDIARHAKEAMGAAPATDMPAPSASAEPLGPPEPPPPPGTLGDPRNPTLTALRYLTKGGSSGFSNKAAAALEATAASANQWARKHAPALVPDKPTITEESTGGVGDIPWSERFKTSLEGSRQRDVEAAGANPKTALAFDVAGSMAPTSKLIGSAKGLSLVGRSALAGGLRAAGETDARTIGELASDLGVSVALGALGALPVAVLDSIPALKSWLAKQAQIEAFKQAAAGNAKSVGGKLAREAGQGRAQQIGQYILDKGLLGKGDMPADILANATALRNTAGSQVGKTIGQSDATVHLPDLIDKLESGVLSDARSGGSLYSGVAGKVQGVVDDLKTIQANLGDDVPAALIHELKVKHAGAIDWASDKPLASALQKVVGTEAGSVFRAVKGAGAGEALKGANREFGLASDLVKTAKKGAESVMNRQIGVSELGSGGAGAVVGALAGGAPGAAIGSMGSALAANFWRKHGSGIAARAMSSVDNIIPTLQASPQMTPYLDLFRRTAAAAGPAGLAALHFELWDKDQTYRQGMQDAEKAGGQ
jgi:hypothetical protein